MLCWMLDTIAGNFWRPEKFKNLANPDFENLKHLQNLEFIEFPKKREEQ